MDVQKKLDEIVRAVSGARSMPMSASCVVNRAELLALLEEVRAALPGSLAQAQELIGGREQLVAEARREAERIVDEARAERGSLISSTQVARHSQDEAERILGEARREAEEIRAEADDYVDSKLANFEVVLTKTIGSVDRGREKLLGRGPGLGEDGVPDADAPEYSPDPQTLIHRADAYVDTKLGAFEAVLAKTLEAVGRGRQKLHGRTAGDALGEHMAAQDAAGTTRRHSSDAEYLAGLAELADPAPIRPPAPRPEPLAPPEPPQLPAYDPLPAAAARPQPPAYEPLPAAALDQPHPPAPQDLFAGYDPQQPQPAYAQYPQDPYAGYQQGYDQPYTPQDPYAYGNIPQQQSHLQQPHAAQAHQQPHQGQQGQQGPEQARPGALDETSFFDTGMIDLDRLRHYEQGQ